MIVWLGLAYLEAAVGYPVELEEQYLVESLFISAHNSRGYTPEAFAAAAVGE
jgi:hypothetical protein